MTGIFAHQLIAQRWIVLDPKAREVLGDLHWTLIGRKQMQHQGHSSVANRRALGKAKKVLHARSDPFRRFLVARRSRIAPFVVVRRQRLDVATDAIRRLERVEAAAARDGREYEEGKRTQG